MNIEEFNQILNAIILSGIALGVFKLFINIILDE
jgi:hypothetical protein